MRNLPRPPSDRNNGQPAIEASLARLSLAPGARQRSIPPRPKVPDKRTESERKHILEQQRMNLLERRINRLPPWQRWPTRPAVLAFRATHSRSKGKMRARDEDLERYRERFLFPLPLSRTRRGDPPAFPNFTHLPPEIRHQIWREAIQDDARLIELQFSSHFHTPSFPACQPCESALRAACWESRAVSDALRRRAAHPREWMFPRRRAPLQMHLPFAPARDTLFFRSLDEEGPARLVDFVHWKRRVQHLALPFPAEGFPPCEALKGALCRMTGLRSLTLIVGCEAMGWRREGAGTGGWIQLRDVEEWYADGRDRRVKVNGTMMDIGDVAAYLSGSLHMGRESGDLQHPSFSAPRHPVAAWKLSQWTPGWRQVEVRVVTWRIRP